jgi:hypothetical protein
MKDWKLTQEEIDNITQIGGTPNDYDREIAKAQAIKLLEWLIVPNQYDCFDYSWETPDGKIHHGIDVVKLQVMLKQIKEVKE